MPLVTKMDVGDKRNFIGMIVNNKIVMNVLNSL